LIIATPDVAHTFDECIVLHGLLLEHSNSLILPIRLLQLHFFFELLDSLQLSIVSNGVELLLKIGEGEGGELDEEVVHHIRVVSLQRNTIWSNEDSMNTIDFLQLIVFIISCLLDLVFLISSITSFLNFTILIILLTLDTGFHLGSENTHFVFSQDNINVVVKLNVHLYGIDNIKFTSSFLVFTISIWDGALSSQDLCHVIILDVGHGLLVIFITSACKIMNVVDQRENSSVHHHQLNQSHVLTFVSLEVLTVKDLYKGKHHNINLDIVQSVC